MKIITEEQIASAVAGLCIRANTSLPADVQNALDKARKTEPWGEYHPPENKWDCDV